MTRNENTSNIARTSPDLKWSSKYGDVQRMKLRFLPAYLDAFAPLVAGAIDFHTTQTGKDKVRLLVLGGGNGIFSRKVLPHVRRHLREIGNSSEIEVVESDVSPAIKAALKAGAPNAPKAVVRADMARLPFGDETFDIIVSESSLYAAKRDRMNKAIGQIKRVLAPSGLLVHIQDGWPGGWNNSDITAEELDGCSRKQLEGIKREANDNLTDAIERHAEEHGLSTRTDKLIGMARVRSLPHMNPQAREAGANTAHWAYGTLKPVIDPHLKPGEYQQVFIGPATIVGKGTSAAAAFEHIYKKFLKED